MLLNHFAFEIWHEILRFCTSSTLSSLSRVNTSLRDLAEYVLYGHIYFSTCPFDLIRDKACKSWALTEKRSLLHTLSTNTRKAAMVKALYIEFERVSSFGVERALHSILVKLSGVLQNMPNLVDLRIVYDKMTDPSKGSLSKMIRFVFNTVITIIDNPSLHRGNHFRLHTLCVEVSHDLEGIITAQPHLQLLGIYYANSDILFGNKIRPLLKTSRCHMMPTVFMLDSSAYITTLALFPSSHRPGEALQVCQEIAASLGMFPKNYYVPDRCHISFHLGGIMKEHISLLQEVMEAMAICMRKYFHCSYLGVIIYDSTIKVTFRLHHCYPLFIFL